MRIEWSTLRSLQSGVDRGVIYPRSVLPVPWNGLVNVTEQVTDSGQSVMYYDGYRYVQTMSPEGFSASIEAITYPDELDINPEFDFSYRTMIDDGYELHLVYNAAIFSEPVDYSANINESSPVSFKWTMYTIPEKLDYAGPSSHIIINSNAVTSDLLAQVEGLLYGTDDQVNPRIPHISELIDMFEVAAVFKIIDNGDGTWTAIGPDSWFETVDATTVNITTPSIEFIDSESYRIRSW